MGYFNFWYNLKYFLRRMPKKILVALCIFLIICIAHLKGYCTEVTNLPNTDYYQYIRTLYDIDFYSLLNIQTRYAKTNNNTFNTEFIYFCKLVTTEPNSVYWFVSSDYKSEFFRKQDRNRGLFGSTYDVDSIAYGVAFDDANNYTYDDFFVIPGSKNASSSTGRQWALATPSGLSYRLQCVKQSHANNTYTFSGNTTGRLYIPAGLEHYIPRDIYQSLYDIGQNQFNFTNSDQLLADIDNNINEINQTLDSMNDFIQDDTTSQYTQNDLPSDSMNDITASSFNSIFTSVYNKMTTEDSQNVTIPIPYLNYNITIGSNTIKNALNNNGFSAIVNIISVVWYGVISLYILKDIYNYINQIKNGDIGHTDTNIKTEVL